MSHLGLPSQKSRDPWVSMCTEVSMEEIIPKNITSAFYQHESRNESWMLAV